MTATTSVGLATVSGHFEQLPFLAPNLKGDGVYKVELWDYSDQFRREKFVWWIEPDELRPLSWATSGQDTPHSHPGCFMTEAAARAFVNKIDLSAKAADGWLPSDIDALRDYYVDRLTGGDLLRTHTVTVGDRVVDCLTGFSFVSVILSGGYTSVTYSRQPRVPGDVIDDKTPSSEVIVAREDRIVRAGMVVGYPKDEYHLVTDLLPGTRTHMIIGPGSPEWGYLDPLTGDLHGPESDPTFKERAWKFNPWMRPKAEPNAKP